RVAIVQRAAEIARVSELARLPRVRNLHHVSAGAGEAKARSGIFRLGRVVTQRLQQPAHAVAVGGRAEEYRRDQSIARFVDQVTKHGVAIGRHVGEELLHKLIVEIRELFEQMKTRLRLALGQILRNIDNLGWLALLVAIGPFKREIDETRDFVVLPDRNLTRDQRRVRNRLQRLEQIANAPACGIDLVDEERARNLKLFERLQERLR